MENLEKSIDEKGMNVILFKACRQFYQVYPQIRSIVSNEFITKPELLVKRLSFSHIREIMVLEDEFERFFYETECIKCGWICTFYRMPEQEEKEEVVHTNFTF